MQNCVLANQCTFWQRKTKRKTATEIIGVKQHTSGGVMESCRIELLNEISKMGISLKLSEFFPIAAALFVTTRFLSLRKYLIINKIYKYFVFIFFFNTKCA